MILSVGPVRRPLALTVACVAVLTADWWLWLAGGFTLDDAITSYLLTNTVTAISFAVTAAVILDHHPGHRIGRLFGLFAAAFAAQATTTGILAGPYDLSTSLERGLTIVGNAVWSPGPLIALPLIFQLYPNGRPLAGRWRWLVPTTVAWGLLTGAVLVLQPGPLTTEPIADPSAILDGRAQDVVTAVTPFATAGMVAISLLSVGLLVRRLIRSSGAERLQLLWFVWAVAIYVLLNAQRGLTGDGPILYLLTIPLIPAAAMIAIVRHQLYDIYLVINRTFVYGMLTVSIVAFYFAVVALLGTVANDNLDANPLIASVLIAMAFVPLRQRLQRGVDRLMYGASRDPADTFARVGPHLTADLSGILGAVTSAMRLPYAAFTQDGVLLASVGDTPQLLHAIPLDLGTETPADLLVGLRRGESELSAADRRALDLLAGPLAIAVRSVRLTDQLRESRTHIVAAREDERRRLRRDLHDGLGTALTAVRLKADAAYNLQPTDPVLAAKYLAELRDDLSTSIADVRNLIYGLRPPALDDLGLLGALRQQADQSWRRDGVTLQVTVDAPQSVPKMSAAVEVAAYRIATESVTNALRHGDATTCRITVRFDDSLHLEVQDNGRRKEGTWRPGVGLSSMQERAAEVGGRVTAGPTDRGGRVHAQLPLGER